MSLTNIIPSETLGRIPFSSLHPEFGEQYYWRLSIKPEVIFLGLMWRVVLLDPACNEIVFTQTIQNLLGLFRSSAIQGFSVHRHSISGSSGDLRLCFSRHCHRKQSPNEINTGSRTSQ